MSGSAESEAPHLNPSAADAAASTVSNETLGGVEVERLAPLERAAGAGDAQATAALLAAGTRVPIGGDAAGDRPLRRTILHWASFSGNPDVITAVLEAVGEAGVAAFNASGAAPGGEGQELAAQAAAANAKTAALRATCLREPGGRNGTRPLHLAVRSGRVAAVVVLLDAGADDTHGDGYFKTPLFLAVELGLEEVALELLSRGTAHIDSQPVGCTVLHAASLRSNLGMTKMLLREGAAANALDMVGHTPLHFAVNSGPDAAAIIDALVAAGANVDAIGGPDPFENTPLHKAVIDKPRGNNNDRLRSIRALLTAGAKPHLRDNFNGCSPVEVAMWNSGSNMDVFSFFLELGMDPNHRGPFNPPFRNLAPDASEFERESYGRDRLPYGGESLLHRAAQMLCDGAVELLLAAGAREDIPAFEDIREENSPEIPTLPIDVIGVDIEEMSPVLETRALTIKSMLAGAHLYRKGWLSVLRGRFDAGESLTGGDGGGEQGRVGGRSSGSVEGRSPRRQKGDEHGCGKRHYGVFAVEDEAWYGAAVWIASVPDSGVFRIITECL